MDEETLTSEDTEPPGRPYETWPLGKGGVAAERRPRSIFRLQAPPDGAGAPDNPLVREFRKHFHPSVDDRSWNNWKWQLANRIVTSEPLAGIVSLTDSEREALADQKIMPFAITPYYAALIHGQDGDQELRRTVIPVRDESSLSPGEKRDPLGEESQSPCRGIIHRYPDRVLFLANNACATYCRYCTRSRLVGGPATASPADWDRAIAYIEANKDIRDVIISGGDPLILADETLEKLLLRLRRIEHVEIIRIGTKAPVVLPQRITFRLVSILKRYHPLLVSIHATHPAELTPEMKLACARLADAGIPLGSQTVLLAGINDRMETMKRLFRGLLRFRVKPYYLYQCDPIPGSSHFRTPVKAGLELIGQLRGHTSGYAVPTFVIDAPGGGGKVPLLPESCLGYDNTDLLLRNYEGNVYRYPDAVSNRDLPGNPTGFESRQ